MEASKCTKLVLCLYGWPNVCPRSSSLQFTYFFQYCFNLPSLRRSEFCMFFLFSFWCFPLLLVFCFVFHVGGWVVLPHLGLQPPSVSCLGKNFCFQLSMNDADVKRRVLVVQSQLGCLGFFSNVASSGAVTPFPPASLFLCAPVTWHMHNLDLPLWLTLSTRILKCRTPFVFAVKKDVEFAMNFLKKPNQISCSLKN